MCSGRMLGPALAARGRRPSTVADPAFHDYVDPDQGQPDIPLRQASAASGGGDEPRGYGSTRLG